MGKRVGRVVSVHVGPKDVLHKQACERIELDLQGILGDRHRSYVRHCWQDDKQPMGTARRNERQWSAIAEEDLAAITRSMNLSTPLTAADVGVNLCIAGIDNLSQLPRGTLLSFSSGAVLMVEEYNPPCLDMGKTLAQSHRRMDGEAPAPESFPQAAKFSRGLVGVVEAAGEIRVADELTVENEQLPKWLRR